MHMQQNYRWDFTALHPSYTQIQPHLVRLPDIGQPNPDLRLIGNPDKSG